MPIPISVICRVLIYFLGVSVQPYNQAYTFNRTAFIAGSDPDLHYFCSDDINSITNIYETWLQYLNAIDYHNNFNTTDLPDFSQGFKSPCTGIYSHSDDNFLVVIEDLY